MLKSWQNKFQKSFEAYPNLLMQLTPQQQEQLADLLTTVEQSDLLNDESLRKLLSFSKWYLDELVYLIKKLAESHALNQSTFDYLFTTSSFCELNNNLRWLDDHKLLTAETINSLFSTPYFCSSVQLIKRALREKFPFESIIKFLSRQNDLSGLSRAMTLFDLSGQPYTKEQFKALEILISVLANRLCQIIFDARLRNSSDYSELSEPLSADAAVSILSQLQTVQNQEKRIALFFDFFADFRQLPPGQDDLVQVDVAEEVTKVLRDYCSLMVAAVDSQQDYLRASKTLRELQKNGGNQALFDDLKYRIASAIEFADLCSMRQYEPLMDEIRQALMKPQSELADLMESLKSSKEQFRTVDAEKRRQFLFMAEPVNDQVDDEENDQTSSKRGRRF